MPEWPDSASHRAWLDAHTRHLLAFGRNTADARGGAHWLDGDGRPDRSKPMHTWITARTTHVYALGSLLGVPGSAPIAETALAGLTSRLHDDAHGGWHPSVSHDGRPADGKACYDHAFVLLAAGSAVQAGLAGAADLLAEAQRVFLDRFWSDADGRCVDEWDTAFSAVEPYRGINANMHAVEAMLATASVTGERAWLARADRVCRFVADIAGSHEWRIPEHYDDTWQPDLDLNRDQPDHPFKPFGATIGHGFEWSRLLVHLDAALGSGDGSLVEAAERLFQRAVTDGWAADGAPGFVYTTDWSGTPVVRDRMHWVAAEAIGAAAALHRRTGHPEYAQWYRRWWDYADAYLIDHVRGSWRHQLDHANHLASSVWEGKPDLYHAVQATLIPRLPLYPMLATAVDEGLLA